MFRRMYAALFIISTTINGVGFLGGTLVLTPDGYKKIEDLRVGDHVVCFRKHDECVSRPISKIHKLKTYWLRRVIIDKTVLFCAHDQHFYLPQSNTWTSLIHEDDYLLSRCDKHIKIDSTDIIHAEVNVYDLTVPPYHNFCVSRHNVHVHNIAAGLEFAWYYGAGAGPAGVVVTGTIAFFGWVLGKCMFSDHHGNRHSEYTFNNGRDQYSSNDYGSGFGSSSSQSGSNSESRQEESKKSHTNFNDGNQTPPGGGPSGSGGNGPGNNGPNGPNGPKKPENGNNSNKNNKNNNNMPVIPPVNPNSRRYQQLEKQSNNELKRTIRSQLEHNTEHLDKRDKFIANPDKYDNQGRLANAGNNQELRKKIINGRVKGLDAELIESQCTINDARDILKKRGA